MKLDSVRAFKAELAAEVVPPPEDATLRAFHAEVQPTLPRGLALGVGRRDDGEHVVVVRTSDPVAGEAIRVRAKGEADVRIITVTKRTTPAHYQSALSPLEGGAQVNIRGANFVGTLGCFVKDAKGVYALSNSHVLADMGRTPPGTVIGQPFGSRPIAVLDRFIPYALQGPNLVDCAIARLAATSALLPFNGALGGNITGVRAVTPDLLGAEVRKAGRTTGARRGRITAVEVDGLPVGMDELGVVYFNDQLEVSGGSGPDFSAGGDSGSLILTAAGEAIALLFAGGPDSTGEDFTYGNYLTNVLSALGVTLAL